MCQEFPHFRLCLPHTAPCNATNSNSTLKCGERKIFERRKCITCIFTTRRNKFHSKIFMRRQKIQFRCYCTLHIDRSRDTAAHYACYLASLPTLAFTCVERVCNTNRCILAHKIFMEFGNISHYSIGWKSHRLWSTQVEKLWRHPSMIQ